MTAPIIPGLPNWRAQELLGWMYHRTKTKPRNDFLMRVRLSERIALVNARAAMWSDREPDRIVGTHTGRHLWNHLRARIK